MHYREYIRGSRGVAMGIILLLLVSFGVRYYHFEEWLYFKMDQARDAALISQSVLNGPEHLPLLGARSGATELAQGRLRLGPAYYYMQYTAGVLAGSVEPYVFAYPDLFFGVAAILMLFFLARLSFSPYVSLGIATLYGLCFIVIQYARFAWNPNTLPFFLFLSFYGLLRFLNEPDDKKRYRWLMLWIGGLTIGSQLHFFGVFSLIGISGLMFVWHFELWRLSVWKNMRQRSVWLPVVRYVCAGLLLALFLYTPVIISDVYRHGENTHNFFEAMASKPGKQSLTQKVFETVSQNSRYYCLIVTARCTTENTWNILPQMATSIFLLGGIVLCALRLRRMTPGVRQDFLRLIIVWLGVFSILSLPVAFQLRPRFFLVTMALPFLLWGVWHEFLQERWARRGVWVSVSLFFIILGLNIQGTGAWFREQAQSQERDTPVTRTLILKAKDGVTLGQLERVTQFMMDRHREGNRIYYYVKPEHISPMKYLLRLQQQQYPTLEYASYEWNTDPQAQFFAIVPAEQDNLSSFAKKVGQPFEIVAMETVGQLRVAEVTFSHRVTEADFKVKQNNTADDRVYWGDLFGVSDTQDEDETDDAGDE